MNLYMKKYETVSNELLGQRLSNEVWSIYDFFLFIWNRLWTGCIKCRL
jgi:hypothetical protein